MLAIGVEQPCCEKRRAENTDAATLVNRLQKANQDVIAGDFSKAEAMLIDQAHVLQSVFVKMTMLMNQCEYMHQLVSYARAALRAQNQCQRTLKTLLEFKNPKRSTFIKQQNNTLNQQFNEAEKAEKEINPANELVEQKVESWLDPGTSKEAVEDDTAVETMGKVSGAKDS